jgi:hypothetical protein
MGILLYFLDSCIFSPCLYGYTKSDLASNCIADCISWNSVAIFINHIHGPIVYMAVKNLMEHYNTLFLCWTGWMGIWRISRNTDCNVGSRCIFTQYDVNARTYSSYAASRTSPHGFWGSLCNNARPYKKTYE